VLSFVDLPGRTLTLPSSLSVRACVLGLLEERLPAIHSISSTQVRAQVYTYKLLHPLLHFFGNLQASLHLLEGSTTATAVAGCVQVIFFSGAVLLLTFHRKWS
jgi:hypothetical protein